MPTRNGRVGAREVRPGPGPLVPARVAEIQRQRLLAAMIDVAADRGAANVTVAHAVSRAGVSRRTFYELFADRDECLLAAFDYAIAQATAAVVPAYESASGWRERIRTGLAALLAFFEEEPNMGRLCIVEVLAAGEPALEHRARVLDALIAAVDGGRVEVKPAAQPPPLTAEGIVGAVLALIHARLLVPGRALVPSVRDRLSPLLGELMSTIVLPYLGAAAAKRELARPTPKPTPGRSPGAFAGNPLEGLNMRLTYRTLRVLAAIGETPNASNRRIADVAGIADQGQVSKLLARLEELGLIANTGAGHARGGPNAWRLTKRGEQIEAAVSGDQ